MPRWYFEQAKAAPGVVRELARTPRAWDREVRGMVREMRDDENRPPDKKK